MSQTLLTFRLFCPPSLEMEISRNLFSVGSSEIRLPEAKIVLLKGADLSILEIGIRQQLFFSVLGEIITLYPKNAVFALNEPKGCMDKSIDVHNTISKQIAPLERDNLTFRWRGLDLPSFFSKIGRQCSQLLG